MQSIITDPGDHRKKLQDLLTATTGVVRIASAYVTDSRFLCAAREAGREVRLLTAMTRSDIDCGATSLQALCELVKCGVQCRCLFERPKFHAKVYIMGHDSALVTSANLTHNAFDRNIEVGTLVQGESVNELTDWYDLLWASAKSLNAALIVDLMRQTDISRGEYLLQRNRQPLIYSKASKEATDPSPSSQVVKPTRQYFFCNTNKRYNASAEALMNSRGVVAAWGDYQYISHFRRVTKGDIIFMYAKGVGIIAIGQAKDKGIKLVPGASGLLITDTGQMEWQIPVSWLIWVDAKQAAAWYPVQPKTFVNISANKYAERRMAVIQHLLGDEAIPS